MGARRSSSELRLTGQYSFDFIEAADGDLVAIECNPRTHSAITMFYDHPDLARPTSRPAACRRSGRDPASRPTYWLYHELWRLLRPADGALASACGSSARGKDAIFDLVDPLPFLLRAPPADPVAAAAATCVPAQDWIRIDFNIGKLVEPAGD